MITFDMNYQNHLLATVSVTHYVNDGLDMVLPVILPILVERYSLTFFQMGLIITSYFISASFLQPIIGYASDITGRKKLYLCSGLILLAFSLYMMQFAHNFFLMATCAFTAGLGYAIYHPEVIAFIGYHIKDRRGLGLGIHGLGGSAGRAFFPLITSTIASLFGLGISLLAALVIGIFASLLAFLILREISEPLEKRLDFKQVGGIVILLSVILALRSAFFYGTVSFVPTYFVKVLNSDMVWSGLSVFIMMIAGLVTQPIGGHLSDIFGRRKVYAVSSFISGIGFIVFLVLPLPISLVALGITGFFIFLGFPMTFAIISDTIPKETMSGNTGIVSGIGGIGSVLSPMMVGLLADHFGLYLALFIPISFTIIAGILTLFLPKK